MKGDNVKKVLLHAVRIVECHFYDTGSQPSYVRCIQYWLACTCCDPVSACVYLVILSITRYTQKSAKENLLQSKN